ncbi:MAG: hypothetical protein IIA83_10630 [Thaumarchaeota archaeon]|nr:hypothetical protein [Nitrososphaerota archaeon]
MKVGRKLISLWVGCFVAIILVAVIGTSYFLEPDRDGIFPKRSIKMVYSEGIKMYGFQLTINPAIDRNFIHTRFTPDILERNKWGLIGIVLPYKGTLGENSGWHIEPFDESVVLVKQYHCNETEPCKNPGQENITFLLDDKIDKKNSFHHRVLFKFGDSAPPRNEYDYLLGLEQNNEHYELGFTKLDNRKVMISLDKSAVNIRTEPEAERSSSFSDKFLERIWPIERGITYTTEYEIPFEKEMEEWYSNIPTYVALVIGAIGIMPLLSRFWRKEGVESHQQPNLQIFIKEPKFKEKFVEFFRELKNEGALPASNIKLYFAEKAFELTLAEIVRNEKEIKKLEFPARGSFTPGHSVTDWHRTNWDMSKLLYQIIWITYEFPVNNREERIFVFLFHNNEVKKFAIFIDSDIKKVRKELESE